MHLLKISEHVKAAVQTKGMVGLRFNAIGVSDGISNGTDGMAYSLQSRDLIADSIETVEHSSWRGDCQQVMGAQYYDANISIPGCDKNMPGCVMAMARVNRPALMLYGGTIRAGCGSLPGAESQGKPLDIISAFQAYGQYVSGKISDEERLNIVRFERVSSDSLTGACR